MCSMYASSFEKNRAWWFHNGHIALNLSEHSQCCDFHSTNFKVKTVKLTRSSFSLCSKINLELRYTNINLNRDQAPFGALGSPLKIQNGRQNDRNRIYKLQQNTRCRFQLNWSYYTRLLLCFNHQIVHFWSKSRLQLSYLLTQGVMTSQLWLG